MNEKVKIKTWKEHQEAMKPWLAEETDEEVAEYEQRSQENCQKMNESKSGLGGGLLIF